MSICQVTNNLQAWIVALTTLQSHDILLQKVERLSFTTLYEAIGSAK